MDHLNVMEAMTLLRGTVNTIRRVRDDDAGLERQVMASINFASDKYGIDGITDHETPQDDMTNIRRQ